MPRRIPLARLVENRLRELLKGPSLDPAQRLDAIKLGIDWVKAERRAQRQAEDDEGSFFDNLDDSDPEPDR